ncbi:hypothetical protein WAI453_006939 [Rhynchosporium graminicola]
MACLPQKPLLSSPIRCHSSSITITLTTTPQEDFPQIFQQESRGEGKPYLLGTSHYKPSNPSSFPIQMAACIKDHEAVEHETRK